MRDFDVIVLGAGLSGLVAAHALKAAGRRVLVLERNRHVGGRLVSQRIGGFLMEHGPTGIAGPAPVVEGLAESLGLSGERVDRGENVKHRYLVRNGVARALSVHPLRFFLSDFFSLAGRLRMMAEPLVPARDGDETVAGFVRRRFGREMLEYVFDPLVGGLHSGDPERLSVSALLPRLKELERRHGSVTLGVMKRILSGTSGGMPGRTLFSFRDGMGMLPLALASGLGDSLVAGARAERVTPAAGGGFAVRIERDGLREELRASCVVVALPSYGAALVLADFMPDAAGLLAGIEHPPLAVVFLGYRLEDLPHPLDGLGFLSPGVENRQSLGMMFSSSLFPGRAPAGHVALTAFVGGARQPDLARLPPAEMEAAMAAEAASLLGAKKLPVLSRSRYWMRGLPQYAIGHSERIAALRSAESATPGLFLTGNYLGGVSTAACVEQALATAGRVAARLDGAEARRHLTGGTKRVINQ